RSHRAAQSLRRKLSTDCWSCTSPPPLPEPDRRGARGLARPLLPKPAREVHSTMRAVMERMSQQVKVAAVSGLIAGAATAVVLMLRGARETGTALAPINATSHVAWGDEAAQTNAVDMKHTA